MCRRRMCRPCALAIAIATTLRGAVAQFLRRHSIAVQSGIRIRNSTYAIRRPPHGPNQYGIRIRNRQDADPPTVTGPIRNTDTEYVTEYAIRRPTHGSTIYGIRMYGIRNTQTRSPVLNTEYGYAIRNTQTRSPVTGPQNGIRIQNTQYAIYASVLTVHYRLSTAVYDLRVPTIRAQLRNTQNASRSPNTQNPSTQYAT